jgi:hypothetical protein
VSLGAEGTPLVKGPERHFKSSSGCLALFDVNKKRLPESGQNRTR